jgi:hypothetical protein
MSSFGAMTPQTLLQGQREVVSNTRPDALRKIHLDASACLARHKKT